MNLLKEALIDLEDQPNVSGKEAEQLVQEVRKAAINRREWLVAKLQAEWIRV
jgi:hypothetical protein